MVSLPSIQEELKAIHRRLEQEITFKSAKFADLVPLTLDELEHNTCPAILLAVSRACGYSGRHAISMGMVMQFVFIADKVHTLMQEDEEITEDLRQFTVLVGDYLFGKFFLGLSREKLLHFLAPIAKVIENMSIGTIFRWLDRESKLTPEEWLKILEKERASLTGLAARLGAELAGMPSTIAQKCEFFGSQLGLAWAAHHEKLEEKVVAKIMHNAETFLQELPDTLELKPLSELYDYMKVQLEVG